MDWNVFVAAGAAVLVFVASAWKILDGRSLLRRIESLSSSRAALPEGHASIDHLDAELLRISGRIAARAEPHFFPKALDVTLFVSAGVGLVSLAINYALNVGTGPLNGAETFWLFSSMFVAVGSLTIWLAFQVVETIDKAIEGRRAARESSE